AELPMCKCKYELAGPRIRKGSKHHGLDGAEDRGPRAHSERERDHGDDREGRRLDQLTQREAYVVRQLAKIFGRDHLPLPLIADASTFGVDAGDVTEFRDGR